MKNLTKNDLQLLTFLYKDCQSQTYYPHIVIAIEDMKPCSLTIKQILVSMDKLSMLKAYNIEEDENEPLFKNFLEWNIPNEERQKDKSLPRKVFDLELNVNLSKKLLDNCTLDKNNLDMWHRYIFTL